MTRPLLPEDRVDPAIREAIASNHRDIVDEVERAVAGHDVVVVGMKQNPFPRRARKALTAAGIPFHYLEYGSYLNTWRRRTALKIWRSSSNSIPEYVPLANFNAMREATFEYGRYPISA